MDTQNLHHKGVQIAFRKIKLEFLTHFARFSNLILNHNTEIRAQMHYDESGW